jgi:uncharacterized protein
MRRHQPAPPNSPTALPGSRGEHELQGHAGSQDRAHRFYRQQVLERLNERMIQFIGRQEMVWIATADGQGECDCSFRAGQPGFVQVLDPWTLRYPEYRGNGERPRVERWVEVRVREAYIHCRKHLPHLVKVTGEARPWGTDDARAKGGDYFGSSCESRPWADG